MTWATSGCPAKVCNTLGIRECMRLPWPAAKMTTLGRGRIEVKLSHEHQFMEVWRSAVSRYAAQLLKVSVVRVCIARAGIKHPLRVGPNSARPPFVASVRDAGRPWYAARAHLRHSAPIRAPPDILPRAHIGPRRNARPLPRRLRRHLSPDRQGCRDAVRDRAPIAAATADGARPYAARNVLRPHLE